MFAALWSGILFSDASDLTTTLQRSVSNKEESRNYTPRADSVELQPTPRLE
jgi:hypothetical protein